MPQDPQKKQDPRTEQALASLQALAKSGFDKLGSFYLDQDRKEEKFNADAQKDNEAHNADMMSKVMDMWSQQLDMKKQEADLHKAESEAAIKQFEANQVQQLTDDSMFDAGFESMQPGSPLQPPAYSPERRVALDQIMTAVALQNQAAATARGAVPDDVWYETLQQYRDLNPQITEALKPEALAEKSLTSRPALGFVGTLLGGAVDLVTAPFRGGDVFQGPGTDVFGGNVGRRNAAELLELRRQLDPILGLKVQAVTEEASQQRGLAKMMQDFGQQSLAMSQGGGGDPVMMRHNIEDLQAQEAYVSEGIRNFKELAAQAQGSAGRMFGAGVLGEDTAQGIGNDLLAAFVSLQDPRIAQDPQMRSMMESNIRRVIEDQLAQGTDVLAELRAGIEEVAPAVQSMMRSGMEGKGERAVRNKLSAATSVEQTLQSFLSYIEGVQGGMAKEMEDQARVGEAKARISERNRQYKNQTTNQSPQYLERPNRFQSR